MIDPSRFDFVKPRSSAFHFGSRTAGESQNFIWPLPTTASRSFTKFGSNALEIQQMIIQHLLNILVEDFISERSSYAVFVSNLSALQYVSRSFISEICHRQIIHTRRSLYDDINTMGPATSPISSKAAPHQQSTPPVPTSNVPPLPTSNVPPMPTPNAPAATTYRRRLISMHQYTLQFGTSRVPTKEWELFWRCLRAWYVFGE